MKYSGSKPKQKIHKSKLQSSRLLRNGNRALRSVVPSKCGHHLREPLTSNVSNRLSFRIRCRIGPCSQTAYAQISSAMYLCHKTSSKVAAASTPPVHHSTILMGKRELVALLNLSSWCLVMVEWLFLAVLWGCLLFVIVVFPDHTHLLLSKCLDEQNYLSFSKNNLCNFIFNKLYKMSSLKLNIYYFKIPCTIYNECIWMAYMV